MKERVRVLFIDDEPMLLSSVRRMLQREDLEFITADNGASGLDKFAEYHPDVVFSDILMPEMDGIEFLSRVRELDEDATVVLVTAHVDKQKLTKAIQLGAFDFIEKPVSYGSIQIALKRALRHRNLLRQRRQSASQASRVESFSRKINSVFSLEDLFECLTVELGPALGVRFFSLFLYDEGKQRVDLACSNHLSHSRIKHLELENMKGPMKDVIAQCKPVVVSDFEHSAYSQRLDSNRRKQYVNKSSATIPLVVRDSLVGVLNLNDKLEPPEEFEEKDLAFLIICAEHLASAISVRQESAKLARTLGKLEKTQQSLVQSEKLAAVIKLVAGMAHELKNPLTSLQFAAANISDELERYAASGVDVNRGKGFVKTLLAEIDRLHNKVHRFAMFARPRRVRRNRCLPDDVIREAMKQVEPRCREGGVKMELSFDRPLPAVVVDSEAFAEAILNLLVNAVEAAGDQGWVEVTARHANGRIQIGVRDNGKGIPEESTARVFDLFFTTKPKGSGIGLSQVHVFCDTHGGRISFETGTEGTHFVMELPVAEEDQKLDDIG